MTGFFSNYFEQSEIDKVLTSETCTLDAVLESPDCFQECMSGNAGLLMYLCQMEHLELMIELMLYESTENIAYRHLFADPERHARLAYIASEIIDSDAENLMESLTDNPVLLHKIFVYLDSPAPLGENRAYFIKVFAGLIRNTYNQTNRVLDYWYEAKQKGTFDIIAGLMRHIGTCSAHLLTLLTLEDMIPAAQSFSTWAMHNGLPQGMLDTLSLPPRDVAPGTPQDEIDVLDEASKVGAIWAAVMVLSFEGCSMENSVPELLPTAWLSSHSAGEEGDPRFIPAVLDLYLRESKRSPASGVIPIASDLLQRVVRAFTGPTPVPQENGAFPPQYIMTHSLESILKRSKEIKECLSDAPQACESTCTSVIQMQTWTVQPFGHVRLKMLELVRAIGLVDLHEVYCWFLDEGIVTLMLTIFEQYEHNNLVHSLVIGTLRSLVSANDPLVDKRLITEVHLPEWLTTMYSKGRATHAPYTAYLHELLSLISSFEDARGFTSEGDWASVAEGLADEAARRAQSHEPVPPEQLTPDGEGALQRGPTDDDDLGVVKLEFLPPPPPEAPNTSTPTPTPAPARTETPPRPISGGGGQFNPVSEPDDSQLTSLFNAPEEKKVEANWVSFGTTPYAENPVRSPTSPGETRNPSFDMTPTFVDLPPFGKEDGAPPPIQTSSPPSIPDKRGLFNMSIDSLSVQPPAAARLVTTSVTTDDSLFPARPSSATTTDTSATDVSVTNSTGSVSKALGDDLWKNIAGSLDQGLSDPKLGDTKEKAKTLAELQAEQDRQKMGGGVAQPQQQQQQQQGNNNWTTFAPPPATQQSNWQQF